MQIGDQVLFGQHKATITGIDHGEQWSIHRRTPQFQICFTVSGMKHTIWVDQDAVQPIPKAA